MAGKFNVIDQSTLTIVGTVTHADLGDGGPMVFSDEFDDSYVYVAAATTNKLVAINVEDPTAPTVGGTLGGLAVLEGVTAVTYNYRRVYVASSSNTSIAAIHVADPANMKEDPWSEPVVDATLTNVVAMEVLAPDTLMVLSEGDTSVKVLDWSGVVFSSVDATWYTGMVDLVLDSRGTAYVVADGRITALETEIPTAPEVLHQLASADLNGALAAAYDPGGYLFVSTSAGSIVVVDIRNPTAMSVLHVFTDAQLGSNPRLVVIGRRVYVVSSAGFVGIDFSSSSGVEYDDYPFEFDGTYDTDSRIYLQFTGPATVLGIAYDVEDADNSPTDSEE